MLNYSVKIGEFRTIFSKTIRKNLRLNDCFYNMSIKRHRIIKTIKIKWFLFIILLLVELRKRLLCMIY